MARISGPSDLAMDFIQVSDLTVFLPADLPEGGQLQLVVGKSPLAPPSIRLDVPPGGMVALLPSETIAKVLPKLSEEKLPEGARAALLPDFPFYGLPMLKPMWIPEGGFLNVRVGPNVNAMATPSTPLTEGAVIAVLPPEPAEMIRKELERARKAAHAGKGQNPFAITPNGNGVHG